MATWGENLRRLRLRSGITQEELARRLGLKRSAPVTIWETSRKTFLPKPHTIVRISKALGCEPRELLVGVSLPYRDLAGESNADAEILDVSGQKPGDLPVIREGQASPDPKLAYDDAGTPRDHFEEWMTRPYDIKDPKAYGVRVVGDSMIPMLRPGRKVVVSPNLPVVDGDPVYVQLKSGERLIKIARRHGRGYFLESVNPAYPPRFVNRTEIDLMHPIIWARLRE